MARGMNWDRCRRDVLVRRYVTESVYSGFESKSSSTKSRLSIDHLRNVEKLNVQNRIDLKKFHAAVCFAEFRSAIADIFGIGRSDAVAREIARAIRQNDFIPWPRNNENDEKSLQPLKERAH